MTEYRATPEMWVHMEKCADNTSDIASLFIELRSRIEQLEEASMEQSESHLFCVDALVRRIEKLEADQ